jgi:hypothetical protein
VGLLTAGIPDVKYALSQGVDLLPQAPAHTTKSCVPDNACPLPMPEQVLAVGEDVKLPLAKGDFVCFQKYAMAEVCVKLYQRQDRTTG